MGARSIRSSRWHRPYPEVVTATDETPLARDAAFRCSPWTQAQHVDPIGSAARFDAAVLVEWPLPWPRDVSLIPELATAASTPGVRVMAVVPQAKFGSEGMTRVVHHRRTGTNHLAGVDHLVPRTELGELLAALVATPLTDSSPLPSAVGPAPPEVLVCAHGKRDPCCGRWGTLAHVELTARGLPVRTWRCSHTGGHRFAPTAITLPDGRAWAYVDSDLLEGVMDRSLELSSLSLHHRGTSGLDPWAQVVDRAVLEQLGWAWLDQPDVRSHTVVDDDGQRARVELSWPGGTATGEVAIARTLPVLVCGTPPEAATKTAPEYALRSLQLA